MKTMEPKEKACDLVGRFMYYAKSKELGISCAMVACDEILKATKKEIDRPDYYGTVYSTYWKRVSEELREIEKGV
jgi:hypothetical protein